MTKPSSLSGSAGSLASPAVDDAAATLTAIGAIVGCLRRAALPVQDETSSALHGLKPKPRHVAALLQLADRDASSVSELAERLQVSLATASQLVSDLVDLQLVQRVEDPADRRRTLISITDEHRPQVDAVLQHRVRPLQAALDRLPAGDRRCLVRGLGRLATELEAINAEGLS